MNSGLFWGGVIVLGVSYGSSIVYGAANGFSDGLGLLAVPIVGPFLAIGQRKLSCNVSQITPTSDPTAEVNACQREIVNEATTIATLSVLGVVEVFGGGLTLVGLLDRRHTWIRQDVGSTEVAWRPRLLPAGFAVEGTF